MHRRRLPHLTIAIVLLAVAPAFAWQRTITGSETFARAAARSVVASSDGGLFLLEAIDRQPGSCSEAVSKSNAATGALLWRQVVSAYGCGELRIAADVHGDVVVATTTSVMKLAGEDGTALWGPTEISAVTGQLMPTAIVVDAAGDVVVVGSRFKDAETLDHVDRDFVVAKVAGVDGALRWQTVIDGTRAPLDPEHPGAIRYHEDGALTVALDSAGDVIAGGYVTDAGVKKLTVVKLAGRDGGETWRFAAEGADGFARAVAIDAAGAVTAAGDADGYPSVVRLTSTGALAWQYASRAFTGGALDVETVEGGDAVVLGFVNATDASSFVVRLAAADGSERWRFQPPEGAVTLAALALLAGDPVVIGTAVLGPAPGAERFVVVRLEALTGGQSWIASLRSERVDGDAGVALAVAGGDVIAAGAISAGPQGTDATVARFQSATGAQVWRVDAGDVGAGQDEPAALALDPMGNVVAVGMLQNATTSDDFAAVKLGRSDGAELWRHEINGSIGLPRGVLDRALAVATDRAGDVVTAGGVADDVSGGGFAVVKIDGTRGTESWRHLVHDFSYAKDVVVDGNDDVVAVGGYVLGDVMTVMKLAGRDGAESWRHTIAAARPTFGPPGGAVVVDGANDVVVAGAIFPSHSPLVVKLEGGTGIERWRYIVADAPFAEASSVAVDAAGDVLVTGVIQDNGEDLFVAKVDGASGIEQWRYEYDGSAHSFDRGWTVGVDGAGDVIVSGTAHETTNQVGTFVVKLAGATGAERWRRAVVGTPSRVAWENGVPAGDTTVDRRGDVLVTGTTYDRSTGFDFTVAKLAGADGRERWRRSFPGNAPPIDDGVGEPKIMNEFGVDVVTDACGNVFALGRVVNDSGSDMMVAALDGRNGGDLARSCVPGTIDGCPPLPRAGCRRTVKAGTSMLSIDRVAPISQRNRLVWRWRGGEATTGADLGSPLGASDYALCMYETSGAAPRLVLATEVPGGESCGTRSCWRAGRLGDRVTYFDDTGRREGITDIRVQARGVGKSELVVQAERSALVLPPLPLAPPLLLQLSADPGACFEATFEAGGMSRADGTRIRARGGR